MIYSPMENRMPRFNTFRCKLRTPMLAWSGALLALSGVSLHAHEARAISGGTAATGASYAFVAKLDIGGVRSCTGALVKPLWVVTAASCFKFGGVAAAAGAPPQPTTVTVGRLDLTPTNAPNGSVVSAVQIIPSPNRNLVLVKLAKPIETVAPISIATTVPVVGESLLVAGYGRTRSEWVPLKLQVANFTVESLAGAALAITGAGSGTDGGAPSQSVNTCKGDSGGPTLRNRNGVLELVAITNTSWQSGCLAESETRAGTTQARVDDIAGWINQQTVKRHKYGSIPAVAAVSCPCWDRDCWGKFCATPDCAVCNYPRTTYDVKTGDFDADGKTDVLTLSPNASGGWSELALLEMSRGDHFEFQTRKIVTPTHMRNGGADQYYRTLVGDFDGNGISDLATISYDGYGGWADWLALELGTAGAFESQVWAAQTQTYMRQIPNAAYITMTGDFNGDKKTDIATISPDNGGALAQSVALELSKPGGFDSQLWNAVTPIHMHNGGGENAYFVLPGDYNGDGKTDLATISPNGGGSWAEWLAMELAKTGGGFDSTAWPASTPMHMRNGGSGARYHVIAADFTGDGKTDVATVSPNAGGGWASWIALEIAKPGGGFTSTVWAAATPTHMRNGDGNADYRVVAGDVNGDGKADLLTLSTWGGGGWAQWLAVEISTGTGFTSTVWFTPTPQHIRNGSPIEDYRVLTGDLDGNDMTDVTVVSPTGGGSWDHWFTVDLSTGTRFESGAWNALTPIYMRQSMR